MKSNNFILSILLYPIFLVHCGTDDSGKSEIPIREHSVQSVLWHQNAAEYKALTYQAYHLARLQLDNFLSVNGSGKTKLAVIADIDETVLDNSPFNGRLIKLDTNYSPELWVQWGKLATADTIPGALEFFRYVADQGVKIFYISNRFDSQKQVTISNLKKYNFPFADEKHVLLKTGSSEKETRRKSVAESHKILMLLGDNLSDFTSIFDKQGTARRNQLVDSLKSSFGSRFIVFPNPMYGDWETKGIYNGRYNWNPKQLDSLRRMKIKSYK